MFTLKQVMDNSIEQYLSLQVNFIDFKKAYDKIRRGKVFEAIKEWALTIKITRLIKRHKHGI